MQYRYVVGEDFRLQTLIYEVTAMYFYIFYCTAGSWGGKQRRMRPEVPIEVVCCLSPLLACHKTGAAGAVDVVVIARILNFRDALFVGGTH